MARSVEGVRFERALAGTFPKETTIRPLRDHLLVKVTAWTPSTILEVEYHGKPLRGVVVAAGPGCYPKRYNSTRSKTWDSRAFRRCDVKVGDSVELGGLELRGYDFPQVLIDNELHVICREEDVTGIVGDCDHSGATNHKLDGQWRCSCGRTFKRKPKGICQESYGGTD